MKKQELRSMKKPLLRSLNAVGLLALTGCGLNQELSLSAFQSAGGDAQIELPSSSMAKRAVYSSEASALGLSSISKVARYVLLKEISRTSDSVTYEEKTCGVDTVNTGPSSVTFPKNLVDNIPSNQYTYKLVNGGLVMEEGIELLGTTLNNPSDPLPSTDEVVSVDMDGDSKPGVSVSVKVKLVFTVSGEIYVAQKTKWSEKLPSFSKDAAQGNAEYKGTIKWLTEQRILGSSQTLFSSVQPQVTPFEETSTVTLKSFDKDCAALMKERTQLFGTLTLKP